MELIHIATGHAFELLGSLAIIASLLFTAVELRHLEKAQKITNHLTLTRQHREIWLSLYEKPELKRVLEPHPDLAQHPVTAEESLFVTFLIQHLQVAFKAKEAGLFIAPEALSKDVQEFFSLPIPRGVWEKVRDNQDNRFVRFVETAAEFNGANKPK